MIIASTQTRFFLKSLIALALELLFMMNVQAQWIRRDGLYGNVVHALAASGTTVYAGTEGGGVLVSQDGGSGWNLVNTGLTNTTVAALAFSGSNIFAGTMGGIFLSTNNGGAWTAVNTGLTSSFVNAIAVDGPNVFAGTTYGGVFLSNNMGASWTKVNSGLTDTTVLSLAINGGNLFAGTDGGGVFLSSNNGTSWTAVNTGLTGMHVLSMAIAGGAILAGTNAGVFRSPNSGANWTAVNTGLINTYVTALATSGSNIFAGTSGGGTFLSTNDAANWTPSNTGLRDQFVRCLASASNGIFAGTGDQPGYSGSRSVYFSADNGSNWRAVNTELYPYLLCLATSGNTIFAGAAGLEGVFVTTNGVSWSTAGLFQSDVSDLQINGNTLFAASDNGVFSSVDNGASWESLGLTYSYPSSLIVSGSNIFAGTNSSGVYLSTDNGMNWTAVNTGLTSKEVIELATYDNNLFAGTTGGAFLSTNNGANWTALNLGSTEYVQSFAFSGAKIFIGTGKGLFLSNDNGQSFERVLNTDVVSVAVNGSSVYCATYSGVFLSTDNGANWTDLGLSNGDISRFSALAIGGGNMLAATIGYHGLWSMPVCTPPAITQANGDILTPTLTSSSATDNQWYMDGTAISGATNSTLNVTSSGIYSLQLKVGDCTSEFSDDFPVVITGSLHFDRTEIWVSPNPAQDFLKINGIQDNMNSCHFFDLAGRSIAVPMEEVDGVAVADVSQLESGIYILRVKNGNAAYQMKFVKM